MYHNQGQRRPSQAPQQPQDEDQQQQQQQQFRFQQYHQQQQQQNQNNPCLGSRRAARNPELEAKLKHMSLPLAPLVQLTTGLVHPSFPLTILNFWLLTDSELEELAHFYHQRTPSCWSAHYPCPVRWRSDLPLEDKRRKIGRFIGLRGCESPILVHERDVEEMVEEGRRRAALEDEGEEALRRKFGFYR